MSNMKDRREPEFERGAIKNLLLSPDSILASLCHNGVKFLDLLAKSFWRIVFLPYRPLSSSFTFYSTTRAGILPAQRAKFLRRSFKCFNLWRLIMYWYIPYSELYSWNTRSSYFWCKQVDHHWEVLKLWNISIDIFILFVTLTEISNIAYTIVLHIKFLQFLIEHFSNAQFSRLGSILTMSMNTRFFKVFKW